ncbi:hypothetical protein GCM10010458_37020 [Microbacterium luteolum]
MDAGAAMSSSVELMHRSFRVRLWIASAHGRISPLHDGDTAPFRTIVSIRIAEVTIMGT